jgi:hypothetical protein
LGWPSGLWRSSRSPAVLFSLNHLSEIRALWVQRGSLATPAGILAAVDKAKAGKFNTLIVQVRGRGDAYYDSRYEPRPPLLAKQAFDIRSARPHARARAPRGLEGACLGQRQSDLEASRRRIANTSCICILSG